MRLGSGDGQAQRRHLDVSRLARSARASARASRAARSGRTRIDGAWSIPKGEYEEGEDPLAAAKREFTEELGSAPPSPAPFLDLGAIKQPSRKLITAFAVEGDFDPATLKSNRFELEWPPKSGRKQSFPEVDRAQWFAPAEAREKIQPGQAPFIDRLLECLGRWKVADKALTCDPLWPLREPSGSSIF